MPSCTPKKNLDLTLACLAKIEGKSTTTELLQKAIGLLLAKRCKRIRTLVEDMVSHEIYLRRRRVNKIPAA